MKRKFKTKKIYRFRYSQELKYVLVSLGILLVIQKVIINKPIRNIFNNKKLTNYIIKKTFNSYSNIKDLLEIKSNKENVVAVTKEPAAGPVVYIYNTHQTETYQLANTEDYSIRPNVLLVSHLMKEKLSIHGVDSLVENQKITEILSTNNWSYNSSYRASRFLMEEAKKNYSSLVFFLDIHRDSSNKERTTVVQDSISYAKILFVVGLQNPNWMENLRYTEKMVIMINEEASYLCRDNCIYKKSGSGVNGVYNQDFNPYTFLIEIGGQYNTINEVNNTINLLAGIIANFMKEEINEA